MAYLPVREGREMVCSEVEGVARIEGGFVLVPVAELMAAWRACRLAPSGIGDFRAWLAMKEMVARRCQVHRDRDRSPTYDVAELARLLDVTPKRARASVRRLVDAGLIRWATEGIEFHHILKPADVVVDSIGLGRGELAIPRRMLRLLADGARPALIAVALGLLLRCLSRRRGGFDGRGRVKAAWIARTFGVSLRQVKDARAELVDRGWIEPESGDQWAMNRWGGAYRIDLGWKESPPAVCRGAAKSGVEADPKEIQNLDLPGGLDTQVQNLDLGDPPKVFIDDALVGVGSTSAPLPADPGPISAPPDLQTRNPSGRENHQEPAPAADPAGVETKRGGTEDRPLPPPTLNDVRVEDLEDTGRLLDLHGQAVAKGLVTSSEADRLRFVTAAEHARAIGKANPAGLFAYLVRSRSWRYSTQADEDRARRRLRDHLQGPHFDAKPAGTTPDAATRLRGTTSQFDGKLTGGRSLSADAVIVREIRAATIRAGIYRDPWPAFAARNPGWDRGRWDRAMVELGLATP